jgi:hypothetical protein
MLALGTRRSCEQKVRHRRRTANPGEPDRDAGRVWAGRIATRARGSRGGEVDTQTTRWHDSFTMRAAFRSRSITRRLGQEAAALRGGLCTGAVLMALTTSVTAHAQSQENSPLAAGPSPTAENEPAPPTTEAAPSASGSVSPYRSVVAPDLAMGAQAPSHRTVPQTRRREPEVAETETRWYGSHNLIVDGAVTALIIGGGAAESSAALSAGAIGYLIGSPIVHWAHGNVAEGFGSLGLRVAAAGVLLVGTAMCVSSALGGTSDGGCAVAVAGALSVPAVVAIDAAVLAYEEVPTAQVSSTRVVPWMNESRRAVGVNWMGRF